MSTVFRVSGAALVSLAVAAMGTVAFAGERGGGGGGGSKGGSSGGSFKSGNVGSMSSPMRSDSFRSGSTFRSDSGNFKSMPQSPSQGSFSGKQGSFSSKNTPRLDSQTFKSSESMKHDNRWANSDHHGDQDHGHDWDRRRDWWYPGFYWGGPWYSGDYYYGYGTPYYSGGTEVVPYSSAYPPSTDLAPAATMAPATSDFYDQAVSAFQQGDLPGARRLASHAAVDIPGDPSTHFLLSLAMFATHDYRGAAMELHGVVASGDVPDWNTLFRYYGNVQPYTEQLRALETFVEKNPKAGEGRFLLGTHYLMAGHPDAARDQLLHAVTLTPQDRIAGQLLTKSGGTIPPEIAKQQREEMEPQQGSAAGAAEGQDNTAPAPPAPPKF